MASTWSALKIELLETGQNSGTWGTSTNVNLGDAVLGEAITGQATVDFATDADVTITLTDSATSQAARNLRLNITESSTGVGSVRNLILGSGCQIEKFYLINNTGTGAKTVKNTSGTGITVPAGKATLVYNNGTNVVDAASYFSSLTLGSALPVASGGTGITSFGSGVATFLGTPSSANLAAAVTDETGSGSLVFATSPTLVTPALGSPSSVGTMPAFTLGGTVSGGGNQINNVIIGTTTPLAGAFTTVSATTSVTTPSVITSGATALLFRPNGVTRMTVGTDGDPVTTAVPLAVTGTFSSTLDATIQGVTVGRGAGAVGSNTAVGASALAGSVTGGFNTGVGTNALAVNTSGANGSAFGYGAMAANTTGTLNSAFGVNALTANTTGGSNTALGVQALTANTTASGSTAIGYQAAYTNTTGANNTAVGKNALYTNNATENSAFGNNALYGNTTGSFNNAFGASDLAFASALATNTTGGSNNAFGNGALGLNTTGSYNVAFGHQALLNNTTASNNTAVGYQAGYDNTTGINNNYFGYQAGDTVTTGSYNLFVGSRSGSSGATAITGDGNTSIGEAAGFALQGAANYNTFLGQSSGSAITTGAKNTVIGAFSGNQGSLDIRTLSNYIVLSDGDGNPRAFINDSAQIFFDTVTATATAGGTCILGPTSTGGPRIVTGHATGTTGGNFYAQYMYAGSEIGSISQNGTTGVLFNLTSDYRLKNNQQPLTGAKDFVMALQPKKWQWWDGSGEGVGFIAHEFMQVAKYSGRGEKDAVDTEGKPIMQSIQPSSSEVMANLVSLIQEQQAIIESLKARLDAANL